jgi:hypothetical protein
LSDYSDGFAKGFAEVKLEQAGARRLVEHFLDTPGASSGLAIHAIARQRAEEAEGRHTAGDEDEYARGYADGRAAAQQGERL